MNQIHSFLSLLYQYLDEKYFLYLWTLPGRKTSLFKANDLVTMSEMASQLDGDVYFGVGATQKKLADYERPKNEEISVIPGVWVDIDVLHSQAHKSKKLPPDIDAALSLLPGNLPPSVVVNSGYGIHAYWLFREPWTLENAEERNQATELLRSLQAVIKHNASLKNWEIDTTSDLSRVLRLPGTMNHKLKTLVPCKVVQQSDVRYNPDDIEELLPPVQENSNGAREEKFKRLPTDGPASIMLKNCMFMKHCQLNAASLKYDEWLAMLTNIVRSSDGIQAAHDISSLDTARYNQKSTDKKINQALQAMNPQTCDYIRSTISFQGCPQNGCGIQSPCGWSLSRVGQARATVRAVPAPTPDTVYVPEVLGALCLLEKEAPQEYDKFYQSCKGKLNLNTLRAEMKKHRQVNLHIVRSGEKRGDRMISNTVQGVPLDLCLPLNFSITDEGITYVKITSDGNEIKYRAAGAPIIISERVFNVDTQTEKLEIAFKYFGKWRRVLFPRSTIFNSRQIINLADFGVPVSSESAKYLVKWFDALSDINQDRIPVTRSVSKLGWRGDKEFVIPSITTKYRVDIDDDGSKQSISGFTVKGSFEEWKTRMKYLRETPKARFILATSFTAPLLRILGQRIVIVHNWDDTQGGKTACQYASISAWGNPDRLIGTFDTTITALERKAFLYSDLPLAINEREVLSKKRKDEISSMIYMLCEGKGRGRGTKDGLQKQPQWINIVLTTGEGTITNPSSLGGIMTRVLEVQGGPLKHDIEFAKQLYHFLPRNHGHAGPEFIQQLLQVDHQDILDKYNSLRVMLRKKYPDKIDSHIDAVSCIAIADYLSSIWVFGESSEIAKNGAIATAENILSGLITKAEANESERAWNLFIGWLAENQERLSNRSSGTRIGYTENNNVCVFRKAVNDFLMDNFSNSRKIISDWGATGKIEVFGEKNKNGDIAQRKYDTISKTLEGSFRTRVIRLQKLE